MAEPSEVFRAVLVTHMDSNPNKLPAEFAAAIRAVKAEALREAAYDWGDATWQEQWLADGVEDDVSAVQSTVKWLNARADQIEEADGE